MKVYLFFFFASLSIIASAQFVEKAQQNIDSAYTVPMISVSYARQWSGSDLANRFGSNNNVGGSFSIKTKKNWYYGIKGNFLWGGRVKESSILDQIKTDNGFVISDQGRLETVSLDQRGSSFFLNRR